MSKTRKVLAMILTVLIALLLCSCSPSSSEVPTEETADNGETANTGGDTEQQEEASGTWADYFGNSTVADNFYTELTVTQNGTTLSAQKFWLMGNKMKMEFDQGTFYFDYDAGALYMYDASSNSAMKLDIGSMDVTKPTDYSETLDQSVPYTYKGSETIDGMTCSIYEYTLESEGMTGVLYVSDEYDFPVKIQTLTNGTVTNEISYNNLQVGVVTEADVILPANAEITSMTGN